MKKVFLLLLFAALAWLKVQAQPFTGGGFYWTGASTNTSYLPNDWNDPDNWTEDGLATTNIPTAGSGVIILETCTNGFPTIYSTSSPAAECYYLAFGDGNSTPGNHPGMLTLDGGASLTVNKWLYNLMTNANVIKYTNSLENTVHHGTINGGVIFGSFNFQNLYVHNFLTLYKYTNNTRDTCIVDNLLTIGGDMMVDSDVDLIINSSERTLHTNSSTSHLEFHNGSIKIAENENTHILGTLTGNVIVRVHTIKQTTNTDYAHPYNLNTGQRHHYISSPVADSKFYTQLDGTSYSPFNTKPIYLNVVKPKIAATNYNGHPMYNPTYEYPLKIYLTLTGQTTPTCLPCDEEVPYSPAVFPGGLGTSDHNLYLDSCRTHRVRTTPVFRYYDETYGGNADDTTENYGYRGVNYSPSSPTAGQDIGPLEGLFTNFRPADNGFDNDRAPDARFNHIAYKGTINTGSISQTFSNSGYSKDWDGYHIAGNPFVAPIDWAKIYADNTGFSSTIRIWDGVSTAANTLPGTTTMPLLVESGKWIYFDAGGKLKDGNDFEGIIGIGQGFVIQADVDDATLTMDDQVHTVVAADTGAYRVGIIEDNLTLTIKGNNNTDMFHLRMAMQGEGVSGRVSKMFMHQANVFYSMHDKDAYHLNSVPYPVTSTEVPVGIKVKEEGFFQISAKNLTYDQASYRVYLTDHLTSKSTLITPNFTYGCDLRAGNARDRFVLEVARVGSERDKALQGKSLTLTCHAEKGALSLFVSDPMLTEGTVQLTDMTGKSLKPVGVRFENGQAQLSTAGLNSGAYVATLVSSKATTTTRFVLTQ